VPFDDAPEPEDDATEDPWTRIVREKGLSSAEETDFQHHVLSTTTRELDSLSYTDLCDRFDGWAPGTLCKVCSLDDKAGDGSCPLLGEDGNNALCAFKRIGETVTPEPDDTEVKKNVDSLYSFASKQVGKAIGEGLDHPTAHKELCTAFPEAFTFSDEDQTYSLTVTAKAGKLRAYRGKIKHV